MSVDLLMKDGSYYYLCVSVDLLMKDGSYY